MKWLAVGCFAILLGACSKSGKTEAGLSLFEKQNLIAWCIVPFDVKERSPEERAAMLERLGLKRVAYDWRQKHVPEFEQEILAYKKHGLEYFAFWGEHPAAFALFEKYGLHPQIWKMLPSPKADTEEARVEEVARSLLPLVEQTAAMGCKLGIYNHGGWQGEPDNMIAIVEWLRKNHGADHVGIIYNLHHGHEQIQHFAENLKKMMPYLLCLNIDGVNASGEPMILPVGQGDTDKAWIQTIVESGYRGPIGILGHV
ncbi:MAG: TIM barrel protein, partial [Verrucomicrobiae bacterium]|nr:TIM barrel protein [Verrucomicrobiae bacterium]